VLAVITVASRVCSMRCFSSRRVVAYPEANSATGGSAGNSASPVRDHASDEDAFLVLPFDAVKDRTIFPA
jgi:hypothetical protein